MNGSDDPQTAIVRGALLADARAVRLLRAKVAELERRAGGFLADGNPLDHELGYLAAAIALIAQVLADDIEYRHTGRPVV